MRAWLFFVSAVASVALAASHACSPDPQAWVVNNSATASALASTANCSGGIFDVEWIGHFEFPETIYLTDGTVMNIAGAGAGAVADGAGSEQFLNVVKRNAAYARSPCPELCHIVLGRSDLCGGVHYEFQRDDLVQQHRR